jgi:hypothetical protein
MFGFLNATGGQQTAATWVGLSAGWTKEWINFT